MIVLRDEEWKKLRTMMAFLITSGKIKRMHNLMKGATKELLDHIYAEKGSDEPNKSKAIDVKLVYGCYTLDVIARCAFAVKFDKDESGPKHRKAPVENIRMYFNEFPIGRLILLNTMPKLSTFNIKFELRLLNYLAYISSKLISTRRQDPDSSRRDNFLQLLLNLNKLEPIGEHMIDTVESDTKESHHVDNYDKIELEEAIVENSTTTYNNTKN